MIKASTMGALLLTTAFVPLTGQAGPEEIVAEQCASCHALERPDYETLGRAERLTRKAPPLYFAGNKYRQEWLEQYLQSPYTIYPSGYFPQSAVSSTADGDVPDVAALHQHMQLAENDAVAVAGYLMELRPHDDLIAQDTYEPGTVAKRMGTMDFRKFKGCDACHQDATDNGGFSGPRLYDAWTRLQPAYISSFMLHSNEWDPNSIMPVPQMNEQAIHKLIHYLRALGDE